MRVSRETVARLHAGEFNASLGITRRQGRPPSWSGSYGLRREAAMSSTADRPCPSGCGHPVGEHRERPRTLQAVTIHGGCGQPHTAWTPATCADCSAALTAGAGFALGDAPNPEYEGLFTYCQHADCSCRREVGS